MGDWRLMMADVLVLAGMLGVTLAVWGVLRAGDIFVKLHAVSTLAVLVAVIVTAAALAGGGLDVAVRGVLVGVFVLLTAPLSAYALGRTAWRNRAGEGEDG